MIHLEPPDELAMPLGEAMFTQRAIRRLDPDRPITDETLKLVLDAASKAPNGANVQPARFLVVRDRTRIEAFGRLYYEAWWAKRADAYGWTPGQEIPDDSPYRMPAHLASEMVNAPAVVLVFSPGPPELVAGSVFPAVQNLMLAARALGVGSVLTSLHPVVIDRLHTMFNVPDDMGFHACVPLGYPLGNFGPTRRWDSGDTAFIDEWDTRPPWSAR
ncbi:MAG: nitroreductase family protein [Acidimicrobiales bacterium]